MAVRIKKRAMLFMMAVRRSGSRGAEKELLIELRVLP